MLSIVLIIVIWTCNLMPLWADIVCTVLLSIRFLFRLFTTVLKLMDEVKERALSIEEETYYIKEQDK